MVKSVLIDHNKLATEEFFDKVSLASLGVCGRNSNFCQNKNIKIYENKLGLSCAKLRASLNFSGFD